MDVFWQIMTPLSSDEAAALERAADHAIDNYLEKHSDCDDDYGEVTASGIVPSEKEAAAAYTRLNLTFPRPVRDRLKRCSASITIERPGRLDTDALQVSILRFLLERSGDALVMFEDYPLKMSADVLAELSTKEAAEGFAEGPLEPEAEEEGDLETRAERIIDTFEAAEDNLDLAIDLRDQLGRASEGAKNYAVLLVREGPIEDPKAARALKLGAADFEKIASELEDLVAAVRTSK